MRIYNLFEHFEKIDSEIREDARDAKLQRCLAASTGRHPLVVKALDVFIEDCQQELAAVKHLRNTTSIRHAIVTRSKGGEC